MSEQKEELIINKEETNIINIIFYSPPNNGQHHLFKKMVELDKSNKPTNEKDTVLNQKPITQKKPVEFIDDIVKRPKKSLIVHYVDGNDVDKSEEYAAKTDINVYSIDLSILEQGGSLVTQVTNSLDEVQYNKPDTPIILAMTKSKDKALTCKEKDFWKNLAAENKCQFITYFDRKNGLKDLRHKIYEQSFVVANDKTLELKTEYTTDSSYMQAKQNLKATLNKFNVSIVDKRIIWDAVKALEDELSKKLPQTEAEVAAVLNLFTKDCEKVTLSAKPRDIIRNAILTVIAAILINVIAATIGIALGVAFGPVVGAIFGGIIAALGTSVAVGVGINNSFFKPKRAIPQFVNDIKNTETVSGGLNIYNL
jgi:hypothetical protein